MLSFRSSPFSLPMPRAQQIMPFETFSNTKWPLEWGGLSLFDRRPHSCCDCLVISVYKTEQRICQPRRKPTGSEARANENRRASYKYKPCLQNFCQCLEGWICQLKSGAAAERPAWKKEEKKSPTSLKSRLLHAKSCTTSSNFQTLLYQAMPSVKETDRHWEFRSVLVNEGSA